jgi:hypothetical protein
MSEPRLVTMDEFSTKITPEEYSAFLEREKERSYINEATLKDGVPIDADEYILKGAEILVAVSTGV